MDNNSNNENPLAKYFARAKPKPKDGATTIPPVAPETPEETQIVSEGVSAAVEPVVAAVAAPAAPVQASKSQLETQERVASYWPRSARQMSDMLLANVGSRKRPTTEQPSSALHSRDASDFGYAAGDRTEAPAENAAENVDESAAAEVASPSWRVVGR